MQRLSSVRRLYRITAVDTAISGLALRVGPMPVTTAHMMSHIDDDVLNGLESRYAGGLTSADLMGVCAAHGLALSEATLRKYVQLGLLPRSVRVGRKGKHKGSLGLYPARAIRQLVRIKEMMSENYTIEQIRRDFLFMRTDVEQLEEALSSVFRSISAVLEKRRRQGASDVVAREVKNAKRQGERLVEQLSSIEVQLMRIGREHQEAAAQAS